jgi:hypothetical protein
MSEQLQKEVYLDPMIKAELEKVKHRVLTKDRDFVAIVDGEEGVGKSVLVQQIASFLDPNFNIDNIVFTSDEFLRRIKDPNIKKGSCIVLDEAFSAANNRASLTEVNRSMIGVATEMRQKNLFIFMVIPSFFDLDKYFALWRCRALFHVYFTPEEERHYILFPKDSKKMLYLLGKKTYNYSKPIAPFPPCRFFNTYVVNEEDYRDKKANAFKKRVVSNQARKWFIQRNGLIKFIYKNYGLTLDEISKIPAQYAGEIISPQQISNILKEIEQDEET